MHDGDLCGGERGYRSALAGFLNAFENDALAGLEAALGIDVYWFTSNLFSLTQSLVIKAYYAANPPEINLPDYWDSLDDLENILISSDVGLETTVKIIDRLEKKVSDDKYLNTSELNAILKKVITDILGENNTVDIEDYEVPRDQSPYIIMVVGVNGVGKTTSIGT